MFQFDRHWNYFSDQTNHSTRRRKKECTFMNDQEVYQTGNYGTGGITRELSDPYLLYGKEL